MPSFSAHAAVRSLRTTYGHLWRSAAVAAVAAVGLLPLVYVLPAPLWQRAGLAGGCVLYLAVKGVRLRAVWQAVRQLRLESCFIGHSFNGHQLRRCLRRQGHLWAHSYTVRALRRLLARPLPNLLMTDKQDRRVRSEYRRTLDHLHPMRCGLGLLLGMALVGTLAFVGLGTPLGTLAAWPLRAGMTSALVLLGAEVVQTGLRYRARHFFEQLVDTLSDWTMARSVHQLLSGRPSPKAAYRHTPLYRAPAWFAAQAPLRPSAPSGVPSPPPEEDPAPPPLSA